jgi:serine O-acetyltransferase
LSSGQRIHSFARVMWRDLVADLERFPQFRLALVSRGFWAVAMYRVQHGLLALPKAVRIAAKILLAPIAFLVRTASGVDLPAATKIGPGLYIGHFGCIIVSVEAVIGARCNLSPGVVLGRATNGGVRGAPTIGDRVYIAPGAKVFGPVTVGSDSAIGANAVVNANVPAGVSVAGIPARVISEKGSRDLIEVADVEPDGIASP